MNGVRRPFPACTPSAKSPARASTELIVWGTRAGRRIAERFEPEIPFKRSEIHPWYYPRKEEEIDLALIQQDWLTIRSTLWNYAGIIRTRKRLERAKADLEYLLHRIEKFYREAQMDAKIVGLRNGILVALMITRAALSNPVSRGAHFRKD
jgi:L-aspartate oxidase